MQTRLVHQHVAELPGVTGVERLRKQLAAADERRPVGVAADYRTEIRPLQIEAATEVHLIDLDDAALGVLQHPYDAGEHGRRHLQAVLAGIVWMLENPERGIVEVDEMDFRRCLDLQRPYLGPVIGCYTDWTPLVGRSELFPETLDTSDPWQFSNVLVN